MKNTCIGMSTPYLDNVVMTPYIGVHTEEAVKNLIDVLDKRDCIYIVNRK